MRENYSTVYENDRQGGARQWPILKWEDIVKSHKERQDSSRGLEYGKNINTEINWGYSFMRISWWELWRKSNRYGPTDKQKHPDR